MRCLPTYLSYLWNFCLLRCCCPAPPNVSSVMQTSVSFGILYPIRKCILLAQDRVTAPPFKWGIGDKTPPFLLVSYYSKMHNVTQQFPHNLAFSFSQDNKLQRRGNKMDTDLGQLKFFLETLRYHLVPNIVRI